MKTQQDTRVRMVALENLKETCERASGMSHRYSVTKVTPTRVHVEYSNPDEYGSPHPVTAVYPCYPYGRKEDEDNPRVVLDLLRVIGGDDESWQYFDMIEDAVTLWRAGLDGAAWMTHKEIRDAGLDKRHDDDETATDTCVVCDLPKHDPLDALIKLLEFVTSGRRYEERNPYSIPEVREAMLALGKTPPGSKG